MRVITESAELADFAEDLRQRPFVAVDTEFMREKTYWPILCLIQAAADGVEAIIDPLAKNLDLDPFLNVLRDPAITKVFHAARQDLEIFYRLIDDVPSPLFDTQIAAMACGYGDQIGYEPLMRSLLGARIDKGSRFTDWSRRPLSNAQLAYALSDVTHLREAYPKLKGKLSKDERIEWVEEELQSLYDPELYFVQPENAWRRLKLRNVKPKEMGPLVKLAEWREREAQNRDIPRNRLLKDDALLELARSRPRGRNDLARARAIPSGFEKSSAAEGILAAVSAGVQLTPDQVPSIDRDEKRKPPPDVVELLKVLLKRQCEAYNVAPKLIANTADLEELARDDNANIPALSGWRRKVFGDAALKLKRGEIGLFLNNGKVAFTEMPSPSTPK